MFVLRWTWDLPHRFVALALMATFFVLIGGASLDLGLIEARLGMAAGEQLALVRFSVAGTRPSGRADLHESGVGTGRGRVSDVELGSVAGGDRGRGDWFDALPSRRDRLWWTGGHARRPLLVRQRGVDGPIGGRGLDLITGLAAIAALDRVLSAGSGWLAGCWTGLAFLAGGWPAVAVVLASTLVLGRAASLSWKLLLPPLLAALGWTWWAWSVAPVEVWAAALTMPLTKGPSWWLVPGTLALALPWTPLVLLASAVDTRRVDAARAFLNSRLAPDIRRLSADRHARSWACRGGAPRPRWPDWPSLPRQSVKASSRRVWKSAPGGDSRRSCWFWCSFGLAWRLEPVAIWRRRCLIIAFSASR